MIWPSDVSFEGYSEKKRKWYGTPNHFIGDVPIPAQYALDLIFKTLIDDEENLEYLPTMPEMHYHLAVEVYILNNVSNLKEGINYGGDGYISCVDLL